MKKNENPGDLTQVKHGIWGIFPTFDAFIGFCEEFKVEKDGEKQSSEEDPIKGILHWAKREGLIKKENVKDFETFIKKNSSIIAARKPPIGYNFAKFIKEITEKSNLSVSDIIKDLQDNYTEVLGLGSTDTVTISRLKQDDPFKNNTATKRRALRLLSFWVSKNLHELGWNYPLLFELCTSTKQALEVNEKEGVRIAFHLEAIEGEAIDNDEIEWLNSELVSCIDDLKLGHLIRFKKNISSSATASFFNIPREKGVHEPRYFAQAIRDAICLAHQISVRWSLSEHSSTSKNIKIAIVAGSFQEKGIEGNLDLQIQALLNAKLPNDPVIRVSEFAYLCARVTDIKVVFSSSPVEIEYYNKSSMNVWSVDAFWSLQYYDFVPLLTQKNMTPDNPTSHKEFRESLYLLSGDKFKSLEVINRYPRNTILIMEVAKVLASRRYFNEAYTVLSRALAVEPFNIVCLTYRMAMLVNLALRSYGTPEAELFFKRAMDEGMYIEQNCNFSDEESFIEHGLIYYTLGLTRLNTFRNSKDYIFKKSDKEEVISFIKKSEDYFMKGNIVAASGIGYSSIYYLLLARSIRRLIENDKENNLFSYVEGEGSILKDNKDIFRQVGVEIFSYMGFIDKEPEEQKKTNKNKNSLRHYELTSYQLSIFERRFFAAVDVYNNSVLSKIYIPDIKYAYATVIFDFFPRLTVRLANKVLEYLEEAIELAKKVKEGIYSIAAISNWYSQFQGNGEFIECIQQAIKEIKQKIGEDLETQKDDYIIDYSKLDGLKLTLLNIGNVVDSSYIYYD